VIHRQISIHKDWTLPNTVEGEMILMEDKNIVFYKGNKKNEVCIKDLQTEIAQCLQVENLNFLIGSGCSSYYIDEEKSIPIMSGLACRFFEKYPDFEVQDVKLKTKAEFTNNLEKMLEYMIAVKAVNPISIVDGDIDNKIKLVQEFIKQQIIDGMNCPEVIELYKNFYMKILRNNRRHPINVFTTNYDLYNEKALDSLGFFYNNGFVGTYERKFNPIAYSYAFVENLNLKNDVWDRISEFYNLFKIHGSINWVYENNKLLEKNIKDISEDTVMIYPTPMKDRTTLMTPYSDLLRNMQQMLMKKNTVLMVLGYSFSDDHINRIILNMLAIPSFKLIIFGPSDWEDSKTGEIIKTRIGELTNLNDNRIWIINSKEEIHYFKNFVIQVLPDVLDEVQEKNNLLQRIADLENKIEEINHIDK
jgi:hypothetical protein